MPIATLEQLMDHMGKPQLKDFQKAHIEAVILPGIQQDLEEYLNRPMEKTRIREALKADNTGHIWPSYSPVWSIESCLREDGTTVELSMPTVPAFTPSTDGTRDWDIAGTGQRAEQYKFYVGDWSPYDPLFYGDVPQYYVTYIGGYDGPHDEQIVLAFLEVGKRVVNNQFGIGVGVRRGSTELATTEDQRDPTWTETELKKFDRLRDIVISRPSYNAYVL